MASSTAKLSEALSRLGLDEDCTPEELRASYKQHALRTHPDKNSGNPEATEEFQRVNEAYEIIENYLKRAQHSFGGDHWQRNAFSPFEFDVNLDDIYDDSDFQEYDVDDSDLEDFRSFLDYLRLFENSKLRNSGHCHPRHKAESPEEYQARLKRSREEQTAAEARRAAEAAFRKERLADEREKERIDAERRQKAKAEQKKALAEAQRKKTDTFIRVQHKRTQALRSATFAAARNGKAEEVKKAIWNEGVDAAGGEVKHEEFVDTMPDDTMETLLHIAAKKGDAELFQWLDTRNADMEEQDSKGYTAFHFAVYHGHISIVKYVLDTYSPKEPEHQKIFDTPACSNLLYLAIKSGEPEIVRAILQNGLFGDQDMDSAWSRANKVSRVQQESSDAKVTKNAEILKLLMCYSDLTPTPTPGDGHGTEESEEKFRTQTSRHGGRSGQGKARPETGQGEDRFEFQTQAQYRGRGRGHSRGHGGRGYGRRRGQYQTRS